MRWVKVTALCVLGVSLCLGSTGCFTSGVSRVLPGDSLLDDLTEPAAPQVTRLQQSDPQAFPQDPKSNPPPLPASPTLLPPPIQPPQLSTPPAQAPLAQPPLSQPPLPQRPDVQQTSLRGTNNVRVAVRAWVNGRPVFDCEVMHILQSRRTWYDVMKLPEPQRSEQMATQFTEALDTVIEQEVMYQDAVKKLEKNNSRTLDKLRQAAAAEFEKDLRRIRDSKQVPEGELREFEASMRRHMERSFISMEYVRSRIFPYMNSRIGHDEIKDYYDKHRNEFQTVDTVEWQDVFIAVSPKLPTSADAKRFAEGLIGQCRTVEDFNSLAQFDDGDSKFRKGMGMGTRKGEIKPPEVEDILFRLKEGQVGPVVELSTGVHIIRVVKREFAGQIPLNEAVQNQIRNKLRGQLVDREYRRIVRELKDRSVIERVSAN
ncbi:MAG: peptidyl-prolyl cis-trans isomerase [Planctomycetes bacterium]|nr:peptidyl-prolyl cis-trans isomerase [Planctomycetota bacterium]